MFFCLVTVGIRQLQIIIYEREEENARQFKFKLRDDVIDSNTYELDN